MAPNASTTVGDRVAERRRAVALARHFREAEGLSIAQIDRPSRPLAGDRQGVLLRPTGETARAVKARYQGVRRGCGAYTQARNGKGDADAYGKRCHPDAIVRRWTRELEISAKLEWRNSLGTWSRRQAQPRPSAKTVWFTLEFAPTAGASRGLAPTGQRSR